MTWVVRLNGDGLGPILRHLAKFLQAVANFHHSLLILKFTYLLLIVQHNFPLRWKHLVCLCDLTKAAICCFLMFEWKFIALAKTIRQLTEVLLTAINLAHLFSIQELPVISYLLTRLLNWIDDAG